MRSRKNWNVDWRGDRRDASSLFLPPGFGVLWSVNWSRLLFRLRFHDPKIQLLPVLIDAHDFDAHFVAQTVHLLRVLAAKDVARFDEAIVVVCHRRNMDQPLHEVVDELDEQSERRDARNITVELVTDFVGHEAYFPPGEQLPLRVVGAALSLRSVAGDFGQIFLDLLTAALVEPSVAASAEQPVDHEVRIAADWRREVGIARRREPEVPEILRRVACLLHRLEHQECDWLFDWRALDPLDKLLKMTRPERVERRAERQTEPGDEFLELRHLHRIGLLVHAVQAGSTLGVEIVRHGLVREQHEVLDDPMRDVSLGRDIVLEVDVQGAASIRNLIQEAVSVFILPPSLEVLRERLIARGTDSAEELGVRLRNAPEELKAYKTFDYVIVNDDVEQAAAKLMAIIEAERLRLSRQEGKIRGVVESFLS